MYGQHHAIRDIRTYTKSVDPDQPPRLRRRVWSGSALFDKHNINGTYFYCYVNTSIMYMCFKHRIRANLGLHYLKCPKVPFRVTLAILFHTSIYPSECQRLLTYQQRTVALHKCLSRQKVLRLSVNQFSS